MSRKNLGFPIFFSDLFQAVRRAFPRLRAIVYKEKQSAAYPAFVAYAAALLFDLNGEVYQDRVKHI
jgi:hypothetical protein